MTIYNFEIEELERIAHEYYSWEEFVQFAQSQKQDLGLYDAITLFDEQYDNLYSFKYTVSPVNAREYWAIWKGEEYIGSVSHDVKREDMMKIIAILNKEAVCK